MLQGLTSQIWLRLRFIFICGVFLGFVEGVAADQDNSNKYFRFSYELANTSSERIRDAELVVQLPVKKTRYQYVKKIEASNDFELVVDSVGNQVARFALSNITPYSTRVVSIGAWVDFGDRKNLLDSGEPSQYLGDSTYLQIHSKEISRFAKQFRANSVSDTVKNVSFWLEGNLEKIGFTPNSLGALQALRDKKGDCTEHMYLGIAATRANGIPARAVSGYVYRNSRQVRSNDYHDWYEVFIEGIGWRIVDPFFGSENVSPSDYLGMHIENPSASYEQQPSRFWISDSRISVISD